MKASDLHAQWRALPEVAFATELGSAPCLILAPHPDDESLGCGGLIAAACAAGHAPAVAILTDGSGSHPGSRAYPPARIADIRKAEAIAAMRHLGLPAERLVFLGESDTKVPRSGAAFQRIARILLDWLNTFDCRTLIVPWRHDPHGDHQAAALIGEATARMGNVRLLAYPVWGWTLSSETNIPDEPVRGWRLDITAQLQAKRRAIAAHVSQYGGLIQDDPTGFQLPSNLLDVFDQPWETFLLP